MSINSKQKGKKGELYVVNKFKEHGYECNRTAQFKGNTGRADDIEGIDYIHCEVKFVEKLNIENAMNQAVRDSLTSDIKAMRPSFIKRTIMSYWLHKDLTTGYNYTTSIIQA